MSRISAPDLLKQKQVGGGVWGGVRAGLLYQDLRRDGVRLRDRLAPAGAVQRTVSPRSWYVSGPCSES